MESSQLAVSFEGRRYETDLDRFNRILVIGAGEASALMAKAVEDVVGDRISGGRRPFA